MKSIEYDFEDIHLEDDFNVIDRGVKQKKSFKNKLLDDSKKAAEKHKSKIALLPIPESTKKTLKSFKSIHYDCIIDVLNTGKNSVVLHALKSDADIIIKIFTSIDGSNIASLNAKAAREFKNLRNLHNHKISCPEPIYLFENIVIMTMIGLPKVPADRLRDLKSPNAYGWSMWSLNRMYNSTIDLMFNMYHDAGFVHGSLSPTNILWSNNKFWVTNVCDIVKTDDPLATDYLKKDLVRISKYFQKLGVHVNNSEQLMRKIVWHKKSSKNKR